MRIRWPGAACLRISSITPTHSRRATSVPDLTVLLSMPGGLGAQAGVRCAAKTESSSAGVDFHERVAAAFAACLTPEWQAEHPECGPIIGVDGSGSERGGRRTS